MLKSDNIIRTTKDYLKIIFYFKIFCFVYLCKEIKKREWIKKNVEIQFEYFQCQIHLQFENMRKVIDFKAMSTRLGSFYA